jgi:FAD/FMN-containing dehydrogenase
MRRREFFGVGFGLLRSRSIVGATADRVRPGSPGWPSAGEWASLHRTVGGRLERVMMPTLAPALARKLLSNPFYLGDHPGFTQSSGWIDAWRSQPSAYVVSAQSASDVSAAVRFAAKYRLRLVVKGGGHSYLGGSNAPDSLLVFTRRMDGITLHDAFVPADSHAAPVPAVSVGAGCIWLHVYDAVTTKGGRYVQGGGCTTVGVAGLVQGGGFGSFSKTFGLAAAGLLEAEVVTADGEVRVVNESREPDLFWALKGGGGGTFGIVTRMTLRTHDLPKMFGVVLWRVKAASDKAFRRLLDRFIALYATELFNPHWGEQVRATIDNTFAVQMLFQGLDADQAKLAWTELAGFVADRPSEYATVQPLTVFALPAQRMWDSSFLRQQLPSVIAVDERPNAKPGDYWWAGNSGEAGTFWHGYSSLWLPSELLRDAQRAQLIDAWFAASRHWSVTLHFNKGLAGASANVIAASRNTAMNPQVLNAFALAIIADDGASVFPGLPAPDLVAARRDATSITAAAQALRQAAPEGGSYVSESDYFLVDWQRAHWGEHWPRLVQIKQRYDPNGLFIVRHGVGSERWSSDGFAMV